MPLHIVARPVLATRYGIMQVPSSFVSSRCARGPEYGTARSRCHLWAHVIRHFEQFLGELDLKNPERLDAEGKAERIAKSLFAKYYPNQIFQPSSYVKVGSYGKGTATRPRTDLDILFVLPCDVYERIERLMGNKQSQLLQEVRRTLLITFPGTELSADGQAVIAPFQTYNVDIVPAFRFISGEFAGQYLIADTTDSGRWRLSNPVAEYNWLQRVDAASAGKATHLIKMLKAWKRECNVDIKSISLEILAGLFVTEWEYRDKTIFYYDWMARDFFAFMLRHVNGWVRSAGITEQILLGDCWESKCRSAYNRALKACEAEYADKGFDASSEWRKIFGAQFQVDWLQSLLLARIGA